MYKRLLNRPQLGLSLILLVEFVVHYFVLDSLGISLSANLTGQAYLFNLIAGVLIITVMLRLAATQKDYLGFVFMGGSLLKFLVFFLVFYPVYKEDDHISNQEFSSFFVPYLSALTYKSLVLLRSLNQG